MLVKHTLEAECREQHSYLQSTKGRVGAASVSREIWGELEGYLHVASSALCACVDHREIDPAPGIVTMRHVMIFLRGELVSVNLFIFCTVFCRPRVRNCSVYSTLTCQGQSEKA